VQVVTWKVRTFITKAKVSLRNAPVDIAGFSPAKKIRFPTLPTTPFTYGSLKWNAQIIGNLGSQFLIVIRSIH